VRDAEVTLGPLTVLLGLNGQWVYPEAADSSLST